MGTGRYKVEEIQKVALRYAKREKSLAELTQTGKDFAKMIEDEKSFAHLLEEAQNKNDKKDKDRDNDSVR
jgi:F0F1-type ATP synthase delta subunit